MVRGEAAAWPGVKLRCRHIVTHIPIMSLTPLIIPELTAPFTISPAKTSAFKEEIPIIGLFS